MIDISGTAVLFPGQGAYYRSAIADLRDGYPDTTTIFSEIDEAVRPILGRSVLQDLLASPGLELDEWMRRPPDVLQLALYGIAVSAYRALHARGLRPAVLVGHSFGEIAALVSAGAFTVGEGAEIVCHRTTALRGSDLRDGYMCAVGTDAAGAQRLLDVVGDPDAAVAVENHPNQTVISGPAETLDKVGRLAAVLHLTVLRLKSPYPFHSPLLTGAAADFADRIRHLRQRPLTGRVHSPIIGRDYRDDDVLTDHLAAHLTQPVRFGTALRTLADGGVTAFVESGALDALSRITRATLGTDAQTVAVLVPEPNALDAGLARLTAAGLITPPRPAAEPDLRELLRQVLPGVPTQAIEQFWAQRHHEVLAFARDQFHLHHTPSGTPAGTVTITQPATPRPVHTGPENGGGGGRDVVLGELVGMYAEALEYPAEVFAEDTDLEAELGVDSVKQIELLARVSSRYGLPERPPEFRASGVNTLGRIADLVLANAPQPTTETPAASGNGSAPASGNGLAPASGNGSAAPQVPAQAMPVSGAPAGAAAAPAAAAPAASVAEATGAGRDAVLGELVEMYAEALEYPAEVFAEDTDLEAELGVDSVKQIELLARVSSRYGLPERPPEFRASGVNTLGRIADLVVTGA